MRVGLDGKALLMQKSGIGIYTDRLLKAMLACSPESEFRVYLPFSLRHVILDRDEKRVYLEELAREYPDRTELVPRSFPPLKVQRWIWSRFDWPPIEAVLGKLDLYHATNLMLPPLRKARGVVTIYDLTFKLFPTLHGKGMQAFTRDMRRYVARSDCVIAISEHTRRDVIEHLGIPGERVRVTVLAADERYRVIDDRAAVAAVAGNYGIDREYILYTGTLEPRKNIPLLVRAFHALKEEMKLPHRLVIAGRKGWLYGDIFSEVTRLGLTNEVIFTGYVPDRDLPSLYNGASLFVYPSLYEGFGLPPLEAMACGCPVVTSNVSSLPEVVGDAGLMVTPERAEDLAEAMGRVLADRELADDLRCRGIARSRQFSWERCARETLAIYRQVLGQ